MPPAPPTSRACATRRRGSSPNGTCSRRTWTRSSSALAGCGTSSPALEPLVDLLGRRHPDALVPSVVVVGRLKILDPLGHDVAVGVHGDRPDAGMFGAFPVAPVGLVSTANQTVRRL